MTADENIRSDANEPETYRLGLDTATIEAIQSFIDVRFVPEDDLEYLAFGSAEGPESYAGYSAPAVPQQEPQGSAPVFAKHMLTKTPPPAAVPKQSARGGVLGSLGKAIGGLAHRGKHAKAPSEEPKCELAEKSAEELLFIEEETALEETQVIKDSHAYESAMPASETSVFNQSIRSYPDSTYAGSSAEKRFADVSDVRTVGLKQWLDEVDASFSTTLLRLIDERGFDDVDVYKRAGMSRQLFSRIRSDAEYRPAKKTVLALAVALRLNADEARDLLERAGFALSHSDKRDLVVEYFLENGRHDLMAVNQALYEFDQPLL